ncbi:MAG TPA: type II secretion system F family protein [Candidatus Omnitrophota bacterium]|nr:type II secretion system F family protein [Candidatus Omnitrophota bacterium]
MFGFNRRKRRIETVVGRVAGERLAKGDRANEAERKKAIQQKLKEVEQKRSGQKKFRLSDAIAQAGLPISPLNFVLAVIGLAIAMGGLFYLMISPTMGAVGALLGGFALPRFFLKIRTKRRLARFTFLFADAIDIITRGIRSGLPLGECLKVIAKELPEPVGSEFRAVNEGIRLGMTVEESLNRMSLRVPTAEVRFFAIVVGIQQQTGGNLADTLQKLSDVLRGRKKMRDKIQAMSSEAKASAGIIGSLPVAVGGLLSIIAPDYIGLLFNTSTGNWMLGIGAAVMGTGVLVMRGMINFEM